jgi:hypothetical protein
VLDGADSYRDAHGDEAAARKEQIHFACCQDAVKSCGGDVIRHKDDPFGEPLFKDATLACFFGELSIQYALAAAANLHCSLSLWNSEHQLSWVDQLHSRMAICSDQWSDAHMLMQQAQRGETIVRRNEWDRLSSGEQVLLREGIGARIGLRDGPWFDILDEMESGLDFQLDAELIHKIDALDRRLRITEQEAPREQIRVQ